jgi:hypothetical protein
MSSLIWFTPFDYVGDIAPVMFYEEAECLGLGVALFILLLWLLVLKLLLLTGDIKLFWLCLSGGNEACKDEAWD